MGENTFKNAEIGYTATPIKGLTSYAERMNELVRWVNIEEITVAQYGALAQLVWGQLEALGNTDEWAKHLKD